jgi:hypothetical protein
MTCHSPGGLRSLQVKVQEVVKGTSEGVSGDFTLSFMGSRTGPLLTTATAAEVEAELESLPDITDVQVTKYSFLNNGSMWAVTFMDPYGSVPPLAFAYNETFLNGTGIATSIRQDVMGNEVGGTFMLERANRVTHPISFNASATSLRKTLLQLFELNTGITVDRGAMTTTGGVTWTIIFPQALGNVDPLLVDSSGLSGEGAEATVTTVREGTTVEVQVIRSYASSPLSGTFSFAFRGEQSAELPFDATAAQVEAALESFTYIDDVIVTRTGPDTVNTDKLNDPSYEFVEDYLKYSMNAYAWTVTFASHVGDMPPIGLCCDSKFAFSGRQTLFAVATEDATLLVEEVVKGSGEPLGGTFTLTVDDNATVTTTQPIPFNATEEQVVAALLPLTETGNVSVARSLEDENAQLTWSITFKDWQRAPYIRVQNVTVDDSGLQGTQAHMTLVDAGDWNRKEIQLISAAVSRGNISGCVLKPRTGPAVTLKPFPFNGTAADLQAAFDALGGNVVGSVKVNLEDYISPSNGSVWTVVFNELTRNIGPIDCGGKARVKILHNGTYHSLNGTFRLSYRGQETQPIRHNAAPSVVQARLRQLHGLSQVVVSGGTVGGFRQLRSWNVTFTGMGSDVPMLGTNATGLRGSSPVVTVVEERKGSVVGGTFKLLIDSYPTPPIAADADALEFKAALLQHPKLNSVNVTRSNGTRGQATWSVTFLFKTDEGQMSTNFGNLLPMSVDGSGLTGYGAAVNVTEIQNGTWPIRGKFRVAYGGISTKKIIHWARDHDLTYFLGELQMLPRGFNVTREGPDDNGGYNWTVKLPLGKRLNQTLRVDGAKLFGGNPRIWVNITRQGTIPLGGNFTLGYRQFPTSNVRVTKPIPYNAKAGLVAKRLMELPGVYNVTVTTEAIPPRPRTYYNGARKWHITFGSLAQAGDRPMLRINTTRVRGSLVFANVTETIQGTSAKVHLLRIANYSGTFRLSFSSFNKTFNRTFSTRWLSTKPGEDVLARELSSVTGVGKVVVERRNIRGGYAWWILFADKFHNNGSLRLNTSRLSPPISRSRNGTASIQVAANNTARPLGGYFTFLYGQICDNWQGGYHCFPGESEPVYADNVTTESVLMALRSLPTLLNVSVTLTTAPSVGAYGARPIIAHGYKMKVTFHHVAVNGSGTASSPEYPWTWTPDIAAVQWSGGLITGGT